MYYSIKLVPKKLVKLMNPSVLFKFHSNRPLVLNQQNAQMEAEIAAEEILVRCTDDIQ